MTDAYVDPYAQYIQPSAPSVTPPSNNVAPRILAAEGTGQNPRSSAAGPGQFIDSTWVDMVNKYRPDLAYGKSRDQIVSMKTDPQFAGVAKSLTNAYAAENSEALTNNGNPATPGNVYLAHFAGPNGANAVLKAGPNTPVSQVLGQKVVDANPFLANMTTGQLQQWAANRVGDRPEGFYGGRMHVNISAGPTPPAKQTNEDPYAVYVNGPQNNQSVSTANAALLGLGQGLTANFLDEMQGARAASGVPDIFGGAFQIPVGAARLAYEHITGQPGEATKAYDAAVKQIRDYQQQAQSQHPLAYGAGNLAGAVVPMMAAPEAAPTIMGRVGQAAVLGGAYGAASGAGEGTDLQSRATGAGTGLASGAVGGAVAAPLSEAVGGLAKAGYKYVVQPAVSVVRGLVNPEKEAARRVVGAISNDVQSGHFGLTPREFTTARNAGEPAIIADMGGETTRDLMRSASNTSPTGSAEIRAAVEPRYASQNERFADTIRGLIGRGANATKTRAQLEAAAERENDLRYRPVFVNNPVVSVPSSITDRPVIQQAMKDAVSLAKNRGEKLVGEPELRTILSGDGYHIADEVQNPGKHSLKYWDYVKKAIDTRINGLKRIGGFDDLDGKQKSDLGGLLDAKKALLEHLDKVAPDYKNARSVAAGFFGANNALEAGENAVRFRGDPALIRVQMNKMQPAERELFKEGFASKLAEQIEATGDRTNVINKIYNSPQSRKMIQTVFGEDGATKIEMRLRLENIFQAAKEALGNSTTARQLIQSGLAGGALGAYLEGHDLGSALTGAEHGVGIAAGIRLGGGKLVGYVDRRTAQRVAELLSSDDLTKLAKGLNIAVNNRSVANAIRNLDNRLAAYVGARGGAAISQGAMPAAADQNQQH